jgi:hypothetical protein
MKRAANNTPDKKAYKYQVARSKPDAFRYNKAAADQTDQKMSGMSVVISMFSQFSGASRYNKTAGRPFVGSALSDPCNAPPHAAVAPSLASE